MSSSLREPSSDGEGEPMRHVLNDFVAKASDHVAILQSIYEQP